MRSIFTSKIKISFFFSFLLLTINSCKKENNLDQEQINSEYQKEIHSYQNGVKIASISFEEFTKKVNPQALGNLKDVFLSSPVRKDKLMSVNTNETYNGFMIQTDQIKVLKANGHTSYIFPVKLSSPRAVTFQNLTIDESSEGTKVFVNTYTPSKKWIADWRAGKAGKFEGEISVTYLNNGQVALSNTNTYGSSANGKISATMSSTDKVMLVDANGCDITTYYYDLPYNCASGLHGPDDAGCYLTGEDRAGIAHISFEIKTCNTGGSGGGGTSPNPPGDYNPCDGGSGNPQPVSNHNGATGAKLMVHENSDCNPQPPVLPDPPIDTSNNVKNPCINGALLLALGNNVQSKIKSLMTGTFLQNDEVNLSFESYPFNPNGPNAGADAYARPWNSSNTLNQIIAFNEALLPYKSKEYIVATIYHEILHAYLSNLFPKDQEGKILIPNDHEYMVNNYIAIMSNDLKAQFPSLSETEAWALAWGGLEKTSRYALLSQLAKETIAQINLEYSTKPGTNSSVTSKGSYCP